MNTGTNITLSNKVTRLNPNAAEFVPSAIRPTVHKSVDASRVDQKSALGKAILDRTESTVSNNSDDEAHQYWRHQLPDDITPDFKVMGEVELPGPQQLSLAGLSINDGVETSRLPASRFSEIFSPTQTRSPLSASRLNLSRNLGYSGSAYTEDKPYAPLAAKRWGQENIIAEQQLVSGMEGRHYGGDSRASFVNNLLADPSVIEETGINPLVFLASQYPEFSAETLADVYYASGCNLDLTTDMLHQLELQGDGGFSHNTEVLDTPRLASLDFPSLHMVDGHSGMTAYSGDFQLSPTAFRSSSSISKDSSAGSSNSPQLLASSFNGHGKLLYGDKSRSFGASRTASVWPEMDRAAESREEVRDYVRLRDACLEQASQAYMIGNKALSRELSEKGQMYNLQVKASIRKAGETVNQQRNSFSSQLHGYNHAGQERLIDLQNLHVSEALHVLKHEVSVLRSSARTTGQLLQAVIHVGTSHTSKGTHISQRLPMAIEQYLLGEGIHYTQPQPGLLHIMVY